ncbi:MAG: rane protein [Adhaeribacter sp.]|nr:rane protein [Adhaeribacter sp.]
MSHRNILVAGALIGALGVMIGAFGAHGLAGLLEAHNRVDTFETAVKYHMYHALALLLTGTLLFHIPAKPLRLAGLFFIIGILIFSGSLYILCLTNISWLGAITPIGGVFLIAGWLSLGHGIFHSWPGKVV